MMPGQQMEQGQMQQQPGQQMMNQQQQNQQQFLQQQQNLRMQGRGVVMGAGMRPQMQQNIPQVRANA